MREKTKQALKKQRALLIIGGAVIIFLMVGISLFSSNTNRQTSSHFAKKPSVDLPADKINPQDIWMNRVESQNKLLDQKMKYLEEAVLNGKKQEMASQVEKEHLKEEIAKLKDELTSRAQVVVQDPSYSADPFYDTEMSPSEMPASTFSPLVELVLEEPVETVGDVLNTIPAGTSVKALLVSSVDADCGIYSNSDPIPVKLRLLDNGHLPKEVDVLLKGGIIIGSAYGNLSSERIYVRLERLTQVHPDGKFIETEVAGYISGEDGKYGLRGSVVDKSQKIIGNAAISGLFGEASEVLQSAVGRWRINNYTSTNQGVNEPFLPGSSGGVSNAFDMLADYYIKRAEQVKPVIQVDAGRIVDITFTHGVELGDLYTREHVTQLRERSRRER